MNKRELSLIAEVVTKAVLKHLSVYVRKIVREELEIRGNLIQEEVVERQPQKIDRKKSRALASQIFGNEFREIIESTKPNIKVPVNTGNRLLDEIITNAPREEELVTPRISIPKKDPIQIEQLYENNIKGVPVEVAENIDFSAFMDKMNEIRSEPIAVPASHRGVFKVDKNDIVESQKIGPTKIIKQYKA